ncbi:SDR family oxidoreductase [Pararhodobacter oceanensis]|uniref:Short-chain dehydrogenase n=1 Tax=Pararhodobacter oceanensis TaxID=2172121 RepID=A0A2T8HV08_9RHOB|nr:SDR family NAD(P)-dependent oxidoreductase [Pararhodobacter oceanensis]PVH29281.1 short-chain dehydrogenase [Pararhodobacter oceanensis]
MSTKTAWRNSVAGKSVLITGASRGIGAATARLFAEAGAKLGLAGRPSEALSALAAELDAKLLPCDVTDAAQVEAAVQAMVAAHGRLDVMINNAGVVAPQGPMAEVDPDAWSHQIDVNLKGVFHGMRAALAVMQAAGGTILTIGTGAAHTPREGISAYCASKAGALMLTKVAHLEAGEQLRIMSLSPGSVATDMQAEIRDAGATPSSALDWSAHIPPEWPALALLWMCSPEADAFRGGEVSLRNAEIRATLGLGA